jgi:pimeloyl-ACP methyl ester carboxylesterase
MPYLSINNFKLYYEIEGKGFPLIFLHCWTGNHNLWKYQVSYFSKKYKCITLDFPGHGNSDEIEDYTPEIFSNYLYKLIEKLKLKNLVLIGHSLGGMVSLDFTVKHPEYVTGLVLTDTSARIREYFLQDISTFFGIKVGHFAPSFGKRIVIDAIGVHPFCKREIKEFIKDEVVKVPNEIVVKVLKGIRKFNILNKLKSINVPALIIVGDFDLLTDIRHSFLLYKKIKNSKLKVIKFSGHMTPLERADEFNKLVENFLINMVC